ncbi:GTP cyclohydrolase 1 [Thermocladium modestius]|uniref:GTP cyclohydrolase 1 n=1 Tax=Thermocladium modestius TaxID=62609 RepID=A0A830GU22_9CREN|nr:GTP cyclohydrolase I FolE [Thermocladium modestius]GGP20914.1 GTP cyclohydrolase 1 [Thermocladium modestius]
MNKESGTKIDKAKVSKAMRSILEAIGEDPDREGLRDTPRRVADMYEELLEGYESEVDYTWFTESTDLVVIAGIKFYSLCEHHVLPFMGLAHVAYVPRGKVIGLSKIPRIVQKYARRLQIQERMTHQIAQEIMETTGSPDVMVVTEAYHLCVIMRGAKNTAAMVSMGLRGAFKTDKELRGEVYEMIRPYRLPKWVL